MSCGNWHHMPLVITDRDHPNLSSSSTSQANHPSPQKCPGPQHRRDGHLTHRHLSLYPHVHPARTMTILAPRLISRRLYSNATTSFATSSLLRQRPLRLAMTRLAREDKFVHAYLREFHQSFAHWEEEEKHPSGDSRINSLERAIQDDFAMIRETYGKLRPLSSLSRQ